jgi:cation diffusion facilitator family transporter
MAKANSVKSVLFALGANASIAVAKFVAAKITGSSAMFAEAIHSLADTANQGLLLYGLTKAKRPANEKYPLGYGNEIYFWSFIVAIFLFTMGGMFSLYEGWHKLQHPQPVEAPWIAIGVLVFAIFAEGISLWGAIREINKVRRGRSFWQWFKESRQSELLVVFGEDLAAITGLLLALAFIGLTVLTGNPVYDAIGTLAIGVLLIVIAVVVGIEVKSLLIGESMVPYRRQELEEFLKKRPEVKELYHLITLQMGDQVMVAVKARMCEEFTDARTLIEAINRVERDMKAAFPEIRWSFFEPDIAD